MSFLGTLLGGGLSEPIKAIGNTIDKIFTSDEERLNARNVLKELEDHQVELQVEMNKTESTHRSLLVAGWRPAVGWVCVVGLLYHIFVHPVPELIDILVAMLGLSGLRTYEKFKGLTK